MRTREVPASLAGLAGIAAVGAGAGIGELVGSVAAPTSRPFAVVGGALIDSAPSWAKDAAIALFGTNDKIALLVGIGVVAVALAFLSGWLQAARPPWGAVVVALFGVGGAVVAMTRADAGALSWLPSAVAGATGAVLLWALIRMLPVSVSGRADAEAVADAEADPRPAHAAGSGASRRTFFVWTGTTIGVGVLATIAASARRAGSAAVDAVRAALRLPAPAVAAASVPASAELGIPGLADVVTPNDRFYRIDTALVVPEVDPSDWSLRIHGLVENEIVLTWAELLALPLEESWTTLACVSNPVGGDLIGNAKWLGYPIRSLLERAAPTASADMVLSRSIDGFTASTPLEALTDDRAAILAIGMNGEPLPLAHGFPVRMVVPGLYGYVSATKWVTELEVTRFDAVTAYWTDRGWSARGPVKLQSRIDVPIKGQGLSPGDTVIAGVAWQQQVGISKVEVQVDGGEWRPATLATAISDDTWVQWSIPWKADRGEHPLRCRATNRLGEVQTEVDAWPAPDGATGWHQLNITVA